MKIVNLQYVLFAIVMAIVSLEIRAENNVPATYVDLGLPSGTLWANMNLGASTVSGVGDFFCWGETTSKESYTKENYKWYQSWDVEASTYEDEDGFTHTIEGGTYWGFTKYCWEADKGYKGQVDNLKKLDIDDDAAFVNWGANWRMPTKAELRELKEKCTWEWTSLNGQNGYKVTGVNGNFIFLPASGYQEDGNVYYPNGPIFQRGKFGLYLTNQTGDWSDHASSMYFTNSRIEVDYLTLCNGQFNGYRMYGSSIRPVYVGEPIQKCEMPSIEYRNGNLCFHSATPGVSYVVTISCDDAKTTNVNSELSLASTYNIEVYAKAEGYEKSEVTHAKLIWHNANFIDASNNEINVSSAPIIVYGTHSEIQIKGDIENECITVVSLNGTLQYNNIATSDSLVIPANSGIYVVKIGNKQEVKLFVK